MYFQHTIASLIKTVSGIFLNRTFVIKNDNSQIRHLVAKVSQNAARSSYLSPGREAYLWSSAHFRGTFSVSCYSMSLVSPPLGHRSVPTVFPAPRPGNCHQDLPMPASSHGCPAPQSNQAVQTCTGGAATASPTFQTRRRFGPEGGLGGRGPGSCSFLSWLPCLHYTSAQHPRKDLCSPPWPGSHGRAP